MNIVVKVNSKMPVLFGFAADTYWVLFVFMNAFVC